MQRLVEGLGNAAAILGVGLCLIAGAARLAGQYNLFGFESITLFTVGIGLMVAGCLGKLHALKRTDEHQQ